MSDAEFRLVRIEALLEKLIAAQTPAAGQAAYSAVDFAAQIGRSARWVRGKVAIGVIPRVRAAGSRNVLIPASALESFATGKARL